MWVLPCGQGQSSTGLCWAQGPPASASSAPNQHALRCGTVALDVQARCSRGTLRHVLSRRQHLGVLSVLLPSNSNKHLKDKPGRSVAVCFVCLFLLLLPELTLSPRYLTGEWCYCGCNAGAGAASPCLGCPARASAVPSLASVSTGLMRPFPSVCRSGCKVKQYETPALVLDGCAQVGGSRQGVLSLLSPPLPIRTAQL